MKYEDVTAPHDSAVPHAALLKILFENMVDDVTLDYMILLIRYMVPMIPLSLTLPCKALWTTRPRTQN